jgi:signal transduction histidine kinase
VQYWKQFGALVIVWLRDYRVDPFFRTEVNSIALQIVFALIVASVVSISFTLNTENVSTAIVSGISSSLASNTTPVSESSEIIDEIHRIREQNFGLVLLFIAVTTIVFGYIIARVTLAPARNALAAQKQFIGNIAHELRTPLAIIKTNTEIALIEQRMNKDMREVHTSNIEELDRISEIINNLLSLSALINPEKMIFRPVNLSALADDVAKKYERLAEMSNHKLSLHTRTPTWVVGNATALTQVISNLLKNAINYTPPNGEITLAVSATPFGEIELFVRDTGIGIARKDLDHIFEPFYRAEQSRNRTKGGSGLGLSITSEMVKLHRGRISIRSSEGRGTTVTVHIPAMEHAPTGEITAEKISHRV